MQEGGFSRPEPRVDLGNDDEASDVGVGSEMVIVGLNELRAAMEWHNTPVVTFCIP